MAHSSLSALTVVNTRPEEQASKLSELLVKRGVTVINFPVIEITDLTDTLNSKLTLTRLQKCDIVIFVSANAVIKFMHLLAQAQQDELLADSQIDVSEFPWKLHLATIGKSTAEILKQQTAHCLGAPISADIVPQDGSDSESLLKHPEFEDCKGKNILILRGEGGREFLAEQLRLKGARVDYLELYRRSCPEFNRPPERHQALDIWQKNKIDFIIISSSESLVNLLTILGEVQSNLPNENNVAALSLLVNSKLLVVHKKIKAKARQLGFQQEIIVAEQANNEAIVAALYRYSE